MKINRRRLNNLRWAVREYRAGAREVFEASEVFRIADAQWSVDAHKGMVRLNMWWINPREEPDGRAIGSEIDALMLADPRGCGRFGMRNQELHIKAQYDKHIRMRFMDDVHKIREHLDGRWPSVRIRPDEVDALLKEVFGK